MPPYQTPELGDAPQAMVDEADTIYKGLRKDKFHEETPSARESAARVMWSVLKKTWTKTSEGTRVKRKPETSMTYNDGLSTTVEDMMTLIADGEDDRPDSNYVESELRLGIETEMEHTPDPSIASKIAKDQLDENPNYYSEMKSKRMLNQSVVNQSMVDMALSSMYDMTLARESLVSMKTIEGSTLDPSTIYDIDNQIRGIDVSIGIAQTIANMK